MPIRPIAKGLSQLVPTLLLIFEIRWPPVSKLWLGAAEEVVRGIPLHDAADQEAGNTEVCPSKEKFHTVVLKGVSNNSDTLKNHPLKFLL